MEDSKHSWLNERFYGGMLLDILRKEAKNLSRWPSCRVLNRGLLIMKLPGRGGERGFTFTRSGRTAAL